MTNKPRYVNTTKASLGFATLLTFGYVWASLHTSAPFETYTSALVLALGLITGKRLFQTWKGKGKGFERNDP